MSPLGDAKSVRDFLLLTSQLTFLSCAACPAVTSRWQELFSVLNLKSRHPGAMRHQAGRARLGEGGGLALVSAPKSYFIIVW